jgi:pimeloyl-ACP methyl ester carboxylesterase
LWGFSYGANIGKYLAAQSERVKGLVLIGVNLGRGAEGDFRSNLKQSCDHWEPILKAQRNNTLDWDTLSDEDRVNLRDFKDILAVNLAWGCAILEWPAILPKDIRCPSLWLMGSKNAVAMNSLKKYQMNLPDSQVKSHIIDGLTHEQEFSDIDIVLPTLLEFTHSVWVGNTR